MSRQVDRKFRIWSLFEQGKRLQPDKITCTYRYKKSSTIDAKMWVFGLEPDKTTPTLLLSQQLMDDTDCPRERDMTTVVELKNFLKIVDLWVVIQHYEQLKDCYHIVGVYDVQEIKQGVKGSVDVFDCVGQLTLRSFAINDGAIYTYDNIVTLDHTYDGGVPTHYRASMLADFSDTDWVVYEASPGFAIATRGINRVYLQLKDATEESNVRYSEIGWSGLIEIFVTDTFDPDVNVKTDYTDLITVSYYPQVLPLAADSFNPAVGTFADYTEITTVTVT